MGRKVILESIKKALNLHLQMEALNQVSFNTELNHLLHIQLFLPVIEINKHHY